MSMRTLSRGIKPAVVVALLAAAAMVNAQYASARPPGMAQDGYRRVAEDGYFRACTTMHWTMDCSIYDRKGQKR